MFLTLIRYAQAASKKGRTVLVEVKSLASDHKMQILKDKSEDKVEFIRFDPFVQHYVLYRENKKIRTVDKKSKGD